MLGLAGAVAGQPASGGDEAPDRIVALDPRWMVTFDSAPSAPAGFDEQMAYVPLKDGELVGVDLDQGTVRWALPLATAVTPATGDGLVFAAADDAIVAIDQRLGEAVWRSALDEPLATPLYWDSGWLLASTATGDLIAMRAADGRLVWRLPLGSPLAVAPAPSGERLYVAVRDGRLLALDLETGVGVWSFDLDEPVTGVLALPEQLLVGTRKNRLHSIALTRGRIRWTQRAGADIAGAPVADDRHVYFAALDNVLRALDRRNGHLRWSRNLPSRPASGPLQAGDLVLLPLVTTDIGAYRAATGAEAFTIRAVGETGSIPYLREPNRPTAPRLIAMSRDGVMQGFAPRFEPPPAPLAALPGIRVGG
jgi:outer membrane protein assembly factor BamB